MTTHKDFYAVAIATRRGDTEQLLDFSFKKGEKYSDIKDTILKRMFRWLTDLGSKSGETVGLCLEVDSEVAIQIPYQRATVVKLFEDMAKPDSLFDNQLRIVLSPWVDTGVELVMDPAVIDAYTSGFRILFRPDGTRGYIQPLRRTLPSWESDSSGPVEQMIQNNIDEWIHGHNCAAITSLITLVDAHPGKALYEFINGATHNSIITVQLK